MLAKPHVARVGGSDQRTTTNQVIQSSHNPNIHKIHIYDKLQHVTTTDTALSGIDDGENR